MSFSMPYLYQYFGFKYEFPVSPSITLLKISEKIKSYIQMLSIRYFSPMMRELLTVVIFQKMCQDYSNVIIINVYTVWCGQGSWMQRISSKTIPKKVNKDS